MDRSKMTEEDQDRLKCMLVPYQTLISLMTGKTSVTKELPHDAEVVDTHTDWSRRCISLAIHSMSYLPVPRGMELPLTDPALFVRRWTELPDSAQNQSMEDFLRERIASFKNKHNRLPRFILLGQEQIRGLLFLSPMLVFVGTAVYSFDGLLLLISKSGEAKFF